MTRGLSVAIAIGLVAQTGCSHALRKTVATGGEAAIVPSLWEEPRDLATRDLYNGPGGQALVPRDAGYEFIAEDKRGFSPGFDVRDARGLEWSVKLGLEAQSEVTTSRILWAIGYHQPPTYYVPTWRLTGKHHGDEPPGRFRPKLPNQKVAGDWSWYENPFVGTPEFGGLIVANLILTNWDWQTSNNKIYVESGPEGQRVTRYVVRDLGASLGKFTYPTLLTWFKLHGFGQGTRNDLAGFKKQGFITRVSEDRIEFDYHGIYRDIVKTVTRADVVWACERLSRLSDSQWRDAFRAGGYSPDDTTQFVARIKSKIDEGVRLRASARSAR